MLEVPSNPLHIQFINYSIAQEATLFVYDMPQNSELALLSSASNGVLLPGRDPTFRWYRKELWDHHPSASNCCLLFRLQQETLPTNHTHESPQTDRVRSQVANACCPAEMPIQGRCTRDTLLSASCQSNKGERATLSDAPICRMRT